MRLMQFQGHRAGSTSRKRSRRYRSRTGARCPGLIMAAISARCCSNWGATVFRSSHRTCSRRCASSDRVEDVGGGVNRDRRRRARVHADERSSPGCRRSAGSMNGSRAGTVACRPRRGWRRTAKFQPDARSRELRAQRSRHADAYWRCATGATPLCAITVCVMLAHDHRFYIQRN